jgi:hypothetical protein
MKNYVIVFIVLLLLSCSSENGTKPELTNPVMENEVNEDPTQRSRDWDLVVEDDDGWDIFLNVFYSYNSKIRWRGEMVYGYHNYTGTAWAYYDYDTDIFSISCEDTGFSPLRIINYSFAFNVDDTMNGFWYYNKPVGTSGSSINGWINSGTIGPHGVVAKSPSGELSPKALRIEE